MIRSALASAHVESAVGLHVEQRSLEPLNSVADWLFAGLRMRSSLVMGALHCMVM